MNLTDPKYRSYALVREMLEAPAIMRNFDVNQTAEIADAVKAAGKLFFTGEGSSRIFPAKHAMAAAMRAGRNVRGGMPVSLATAGSFEAAEFDLADWAVIGASNSGQTKEVVSLFQKLEAAGHQKRFAVTAHQNTKLESVANRTVVLSCGKEDAVAATKSVLEQGLVYQSLLCHIAGGGCACGMKAAADAAEEVLAAEYDPEITAKIADSPILYFAGRNDGVAEELTLKTNEITRKKSDFLEGTYLLHGIEEVMNPGETIIIINPFESECTKIKELLVDAIGVNVVAVAAKQTIFPTIVIPSVGRLDGFLQLLAGWNILLQAGIVCGIDLDKPKRARKVGNAF
jgi:glucosamine--fructose-6-phosphate aminotransferase (isomerizing)